MKRTKQIIVTATLLAAVIGGGMVMSANSEAKKAETRPVVRVAIGMDPAEVVKKSSYPLDFSAKGQPFVDPAFRYGGVIITSNVDFELLAPHRVQLEDVRFWGIRTEFDDVESISAD